MDSKMTCAALPSSSVAVIGGGASGLMCAYAAAAHGATVLLFEKNRSEQMLRSEKVYDNAYLGKKLLLTGKGRCNLTNDCSLQDLMDNVKSNAKFLYAAFQTMPPQTIMALFEAAGVPLKVERGNRVFPMSDRAADVLSALKRLVRDAGVTVCNQKVEQILTDGTTCRTNDQQRVKGVVDATGKSYCVDAAVVCTGGLSYPQTGSDGDGYVFAQKVGHTIVKPRPSLVPLLLAEKDCADLQGLSLKNVRLTLTDGLQGKKLYSDIGEMLFTHVGVSGPLVLSASAMIAQMQTGRYYLHIDLKPALEQSVLDRRILADFQKYQNRNMANALQDLLPKKMIPVVLKRCAVPLDAKPNGLTKDHRRKLLCCLKDLSFSIVDYWSMDQAVVTAGGVKTSQVNPSTLESKLCRGLYFAGEVLDVDALTGGFNLQIAFSTGYLAGMAAAKNRKEG